MPRFVRAQLHLVSQLTTLYVDSKQQIDDLCHTRRLFDRTFAVNHKICIENKNNDSTCRCPNLGMKRACLFSDRSSHICQGCKIRDIL